MNDNNDKPPDDPNIAPAPGGADGQDKPCQPRSLRSTVHQRVIEVMRLILQGATPTDIEEYAEEAGWGVKRRRIRGYRELAMKRIDKHFGVQQDRLIRVHFRRVMFLYSKACTLNDIKTAHGLLIDLAKLSGLYPAKPGTVSIDAILLSLQSVDRLVGDLLPDEQSFTRYRDGMLSIVQGLQRLVEKGG